MDEQEWLMDVSPTPYVAYLADDEPDEQISAAVAEIMAARPVFAVGDRVRVNLRECEYCAEDGPIAALEDGTTGYVTEIAGVTQSIPDLADENWRSHIYTVSFDEPGIGEGFNYFAATELEPLP